MNPKENQENLNIKDKAERNTYYTEYLAVLDKLMKVYATTYDTPKLFNRIAQLRNTFHNKTDFESQRKLMQELYKLSSNANIRSTTNPIKGAKKMLQGMGVDISIHGHPISNEIYKALKQIDLNATLKTPDNGLSTLDEALKNIQHKIMYPK